jgi:dTDP-4-dehydrorhamnose 3,5-epimerase
MIKDVNLTPLSIINVPGGDVMHALKSSEIGFVNFGEAYFSNIEFGVIKAWKRHRQMQLNLIVPIGRVKFVLFDDRDGVENSVFQEVFLSPENYLRLTIPPLIWVGFQGLAKENSTLLNIASIEHSDKELDRRSLKDINYSWELSK